MKIDDAIEVQHEQANLTFNNTDHDYTEDEQDSHSENEETDSQSQYENDYDDESTDTTSYNNQDFYEEHTNSVHVYEANSVTLIKENEQAIEGESNPEHVIQGEQLKAKAKDTLIDQECKMVIDNHQRGVKRNKSPTRLDNFSTYELNITTQDSRQKLHDLIEKRTFSHTSAIQSHERTSIPQAHF